MDSLHLTSLFTALLGILYVGLIFQVIYHRRTGDVAFGDGENQYLRGAIRAHGNAGEQIPIFLILFALSEWRDISDTWLIILGTVFLVGRVLNAYGMSAVVHRLRVYGTFLNLNGLIFGLCTLVFSLI